ncbi:hypothetical protein BJV82DRAFT_4550 [Fennellomyces sp. T-0311]|nr:hypothetical protein BJV82DRAFT_4550 [Fennellomyces sp. T-0311]
MLLQKQTIDQSLPPQPAHMQPISQAASVPQQQASSNVSETAPTRSVPQAPAVSQPASRQEPPVAPARSIETQQKQATSSSRVQSIPPHHSPKPLQHPSHNPVAFQRPVLNPHFVPPHPFGPVFAPPPFPMMPPPPHMVHHQPFQPMFPYASQRRVSPPPSMRATSRAGSSQPSVPISQSDVRPAITPVRESAADLSGYRQAQAATGVGSNSPVCDTPWIVPKSEDIPPSPSQVMTADGPVKTAIDSIAKRFKETTLKRKRDMDVQGESGDVAKKVKAIVVSDDDDDYFYDAEEDHVQSQSQSQGRWSSWVGSIVEKFL